MRDVVPPYRVIFDVRDTPTIDSSFAVPGLVVVVVLGAVWWWSSRSRGASVRKQLFFGLLALLAVGWTALVTNVSVTTHDTFCRALRTGTATHVEGVVANFVPMPSGGHGDEHFEVDGHRFGYRSSVLTGGFNHSNGELRSGRFVRIDHVNGVIVRLEVAMN